MLRKVTCSAIGYISLQMRIEPNLSARSVRSNSSSSTSPEGPRAESRESRAGGGGGPSRPRKMSIVPKETIEVIAQSIGIANLSSDVALALASDVEYRLREIMQVFFFFFEVMFLVVGILVVSKRLID